MNFTTIGGAAVMAGVLAGCSVHSQAPIKQVAYDFSDHDHYGRAHGASPEYGPAQHADHPGVVVEIHQAPPAEADADDDDGESRAPASRPVQLARATVVGADDARAMTPVVARDVELQASRVAAPAPARAPAAAARALPGQQGYHAPPAPLMFDDAGEPVAVTVHQVVHEVHQHSTSVRIVHAGPGGYSPGFGHAAGHVPGYGHLPGYGHGPGYAYPAGHGAGYGVVVGRPVGYPHHGVVLRAPIHGVPIVPHELRRTMGLGSKDRPQVVFQPVTSRPALR